MSTAEADSSKLSLAIPDVYLVAQSLEKAIMKKAFEPAELEGFYQSWTRVMSFCESVKRKTEIEDLYRAKEEKVEEVKESEE